MTNAHAFYNYTDRGNGERFGKMWGVEGSNCVRYCPDLDEWFVWDEKKWAEDGRALQRYNYAAITAKNVGKDEFDFIAEKKEKEKAKDRRDKNAARIESDAGMKAMLNQAIPFLIVRQEEMDQEKDLINLENGIFDLRTMKLGKHDAGVMITRIAPVKYDERAKTEKWFAFLDEITMGRKDLQQMMQKMLGSCLWGKNYGRHIHLLTGIGKNGKTTLVETIARILGDDYAYAAPFHLFTETRFDEGTGVQPELSRLRGKRMVYASEPNKNVKFDSGKLKRLSGGNAISAHDKFKPIVQFYPECTIVLEMNKMVRADGLDIAVWDRMVGYPFDFRLEEGKEDIDLPFKLQEEASGILNWLVEGYKALTREGMGQKPKCMIDLMEDYRIKCDPVRGWQMSQYVIPNREKISLVGESYQSFKSYEPETRISKRGFKERMNGLTRTLHDKDGEEYCIEWIERVEGAKYGEGGWKGFEVDIVPTQDEEEDGEIGEIHRMEQGKLGFQKAEDDEDNLDDNFI